MFCAAWMLRVVKQRQRRALSEVLPRLFIVPGVVAVVIGLLGFTSTGRAELPECGEAKPITPCKEATRWAAFPVVGYEPETSWIFGAFGQRYFDSPRSNEARHLAGARPRRSALSGAAFLSLRSQYAAELSPTLYLDDGRWRFTASLGVAYFPNLFWAPGPTSPNDSREKFVERSGALTSTLERQLVDDIYLGWTVEASALQLTEPQAGGLLASRSVAGALGGELLGAGPLLAWDDRDRDFSTRRGGRYEVSMRTFLRWFGADYGFSRVKIDLRHFVPLSDQQVLALRYFSRHAGGNVPFYRLSRLGGQDQFGEQRLLDRWRGILTDEKASHLHDEFRKRLPSLRGQGGEERACEGRCRQDYSLADWVQSTPAGIPVEEASRC